VDVQLDAESTVPFVPDAVNTLPTIQLKTVDVSLLPTTKRDRHDLSEEDMASRKKLDRRKKLTPHKGGRSLVHNRRDRANMATKIEPIATVVSPVAIKLPSCVQEAKEEEKAPSKEVIYECSTSQPNILTDTTIVATVVLAVENPSSALLSSDQTTMPMRERTIFEDTNPQGPASVLVAEAPSKQTMILVAATKEQTDLALRGSAESLSDQTQAAVKSAPTTPTTAQLVSSSSPSSSSSSSSAASSSYMPQSTIPQWVDPEAKQLGDVKKKNEKEQVVQQEKGPKVVTFAQPETKVPVAVVVEGKSTNAATTTTTASTTTTVLLPPYEIRLHERVKLHIRVNSQNLVLTDAETGAQEYRQKLELADDSSLFVFYNMSTISATNVLSMATGLEKAFTPLHPLIEKKLAAYAVSIPYPKLAIMLQSILARFTTVVPGFIGQDAKSCKNFLAEQQKELAAKKQQ